MHVCDVMQGSRKVREVTNFEQQSASASIHLSFELYGRTLLLPGSVYPLI